MGAGGVIMFRMARLLFALLAVASAFIGRTPPSLAQTARFDGVYKGSIILDGGPGFTCNQSTKDFEQIMTISEERVYLQRQAVQQNIVLSGTVSLDGTVSASGLAPRQDNPLLNIISTLTGRID